MPETSPQRLSFNEAIAFVEQTRKAAFAAMPVFGDDEGDEDENTKPLKDEGALAAPSAPPTKM